MDSPKKLKRFCGLDKNDVTLVCWVIKMKSLCQLSYTHSLYMRVNHEHF